MVKGKRVKIGWVGDYKRNGKQFDLAYLVAQRLDAELVVAGPVDSNLYVDREEMPNYYRDLTCLLVTSAFEAHPLCVYEALACGVPVLIEHGVGDCYVNNVRGVFYYKGFDVGNLCNAVKGVLRNRDAMSKEAVHCIRSEWNWGLLRDSYEKMFRDVGRIDFPLVAWLTDVEGWGWEYMGEEVKKFLWRGLEVLPYRSVPRKIFEEKLQNANVVVNHVWDKVNHKTIPDFPVEKNIICVNNPSFLHPENSKRFYEALDGCAAISTTAIQLMDTLKFMGKPVYYASRGMDTERFHP